MLSFMLWETKATLIWGSYGRNRMFETTALGICSSLNSSHKEIKFY
jgi:hypothetical protein